MALKGQLSGRKHFCAAERLLGMEPVREQVAAARCGDALAVSELVRSVWPDAYRIAWSILQDHEDAEDAAQDACARLITAIGSLRDPSRFTVWFYRIVVNQARTKQRERLRHPGIGDEKPESLASDDRIDVDRAIRSLDPSLRIVIVLRYHYDLKSSEIGAVLGLSGVTVRWRLMRAHRRLRPLLESFPQPQGECLDEPLASS